MSDSEGDFSDELLELAGATEKKRRKRQAQSNSSKRKRADLSHTESDSDDAKPDAEGDKSNPYPLEGKYIDDADRVRLMHMSEVEREDILAQRQEEMQRIQDKRNLDQMFRDRTGNGEENISKAAKRSHAQRGATKEKSRKLDELKAKRKAKDEKKRTRNDSPGKRDRSSSPMDMEMSDDESEDGQINKFEELEEKDSGPKEDDQPARYDDFMKVIVSRDNIAKQYLAPWFSEWIKGAWVRYLVGQEGGSSIYRLCEVIDISPKLISPYKINDQTANQELILRHGTSEKTFAMDKVSNSRVTEKEFDRLVKVHAAEKLTFWTKRQINKKAASMAKLAGQTLTESDISAMIARKNQISKKQSSVAISIEKQRLNQARNLAMRRNDLVEVAQIDAQLTAMGGSDSGAREASSKLDELARLNERNRRANLDAARKAGQLEAERKRRDRERKLAALASGTATPDRIKALKDSESRAGTPGTPQTKTVPGTPGSVSPLPMTAKPADPNTSFEDSLLDSVDVDLGDF